MTALSPTLPALVEALPAAPAASPESAFPRARQVAFLHALAACGAERPAAVRAGVSHLTAMASATIGTIRKARSVFIRFDPAAVSRK